MYDSTSKTKLDGHNTAIVLLFSVGLGRRFEDDLQGT